MARAASDLFPALSRRELAPLLSSLFHAEAPPQIGLEAFTVTARALYDFCDAGEVDAALLSISITNDLPISSVRQTLIAN